MRTLPHMGLVMWDQLEDLYDHLELANNFAKLDAHDHTPGRGTQLTTQSIEGEAITEALLATNAVTTRTIAPEAITAETIATGALTGTWATPTLSTKVETSGSGIKARREMGNRVVRLYASGFVKSGKTIAAEEEIFSVGGIYVPSLEAQWVGYSTSGAAVAFKMTTAGVVSPVVELGSTASFHFQITYAL